MIFNVVVDAIIHNWVTVVTETEGGREGIGLSIRYLEAYFYADDGLVALTQLERSMRAFDILSGLFDRVGIRKNTRKTASMYFQP